MNAVDFLISEHNKVRTMFARIAEMLDDLVNSKKMFEELCHELLVHEKMEQTVWYPVIITSPGFEEIIEQLENEETNAESAIKRFKTITSTAKWKQSFLKLKSDVENHANEEESILFPKVLERFGDEELTSLGTEMEDFKLENLEKIKNKNITKPKLRSKKSKKKTKKTKKTAKSLKRNPKNKKRGTKSLKKAKPKSRKNANKRKSNKRKNKR